MPGLRVLVVENQAVLRLDMEDVVRSLGHDVVGTAATAADAVAGAERLRPDVVLMDIGLDGPGDGAEAAQIIRERFDIPSLFISAGSDREKRQRAMASRPLAYLPKPLAAAELKAALALLARPSPLLARVQPQGAQHKALFVALTPVPSAADTSPARPEAENGGPAKTDGEPVP